MDYNSDPAVGEAYTASGMVRSPSLPSTSLPQPGQEMLPVDNIASLPQVIAATPTHGEETPTESVAMNREAKLPETTEHDREDPEGSIPPQHAKRSISDAVGRMNISVLLGGAILSLAATAFLIFLWTDRSPGTDAQTASFVWRYIILGSWLPQVITISTLALRVSISAQAAICTSFVAALTLERRRTPLSKAAAISALRSINTSPRVLLWEMIGKKSTSHPLHPEVFLFILLGVANVAIQFSSTILFADLRSTLIVGFPYQTEKNVTIGDDNYSTVVTWSAPIKDYSLFGELPTNYSADPNSYGLSDTGVKRHAMLPFVEGRESVRSYRGSSIVMSSRVACMPPVVSGEVRTFMDRSSERRFGYMTGQVMYEDSLTRANLGALKKCGSNGCSTIMPFNCSLPSQVFDSAPVVASFCFPELMDPYLASFNWTLDDDPWAPSAAAMVLVFSTNIDDNGWALVENQTAGLPEPRTQGEWQSFDFGLNYGIKISFCFNAMNAMLSNVSMTTKTNLVEPKIRKGLNLSDTENLRKFYGADPSVQDLEERGVLVMDTITDPTNYIHGARWGDWMPASQVSPTTLEWDLMPGTANETWAGCDRCEGDLGPAATDYGRTFLDVLTTTNRAAVAVQTVHTMLAQSIHDQLLDFASVSSPVEITQTVTSTIPTSYKGLVAVVSLVLANHLCILLLTALYIYNSRYTMIGNFWHAASQMMGNTTEKILDKGNLSKDNKIFEGTDGNEYVQLQKSEESGRVGIVEVSHTVNKPNVLQWASKVYRNTRVIVKRQKSRPSKITRSKMQRSRSELESEN